MKNYTEFYNLEEKYAALKIMLKLALADGEISELEQTLLEKYLKETNLRISDEVKSKAQSDKLDNLIGVFKSKLNLQKLQNICKQYADECGIDPEREGKILFEIEKKIEIRKKSLKTDFKTLLRNTVKEFSFLWGQESFHPEIKIGLAAIFTLVACVLGSIFTYRYFFFIKVTKFTYPNFIHVTSGLLIYGALFVRGYMPNPGKNFRNMVFFILDMYLLSLFAMHIIGKNMEMVITTIVFLGLLIAFWIGIKELIGIFLIGVIAVFIFKIMSINQHLGWRAFPFTILAILGISFQSNNFFDDFMEFTGSWMKTSKLNKKLVA